MKLGTPGTETVIGGVTGKPKSFAINSSAIAFDILSSKLYNDKIMAVIRELACNAWDSHIEGNKAYLPFEVNLPTYIDPTFRIKDFGIGMSHDDVMQLYCTYFASSKNTRNDLIGAMGLGSKAPFCYTSGFDIVSIYNGTKRSYNAHLSAENTPEVVQTGHSKTDECNGLEVSFPVDPKDFTEFQNKAAVALEFIWPRPKVNVPNFTFNQTEYISRGKGWGIRKYKASHHTSGIRAIMGNVGYTVGSIDQSKLTKRENQILLNQPLDLFFEIGELEVTASREALSNTPHTVQSILGKFDGIVDGIVEDIKKQIDACETLWEARTLIFNLKTSSMSEFFDEAIKRGAFYGAYSKFNISKEVPTINQMDFNALQIVKFSAAPMGRKRCKKELLFKQKDSDVYRQMLDWVQKEPTRKKDYDIRIEINRSRVFMINDLTKEVGEKYIHYFLQEDEDNKPEKEEGSWRSYRREVTDVHFFTLAHGFTSVDNLNVEVKQLLETLGHPPLMKVSELKEKYAEIFKKKQEERKQRVRGSSREVQLLEVEPKKWSRGRKSESTYSFEHNWKRFGSEEFTEVPEGKKYYLPLKEQRPTEGNFISCEDMVHFVRAVQEIPEFCIKYEPIFGLRATSKKIKDPNWVNLIDYVMTQVPLIMTADKQKDLSMVLGKDFYLNFFGASVSVKKLDTNSEGRQFIEQYRRCRDAKQYNWLTILNKAKELGKFKIDPANIINFEMLFRVFKHRYPMVTGTGCDAHDNVIIEYMLQCDVMRNQATVTEPVATQAVAPQEEEEAHVN